MPCCRISVIVIRCLASEKTPSATKRSDTFNLYCWGRILQQHTPSVHKITCLLAPASYHPPPLIKRCQSHLPRMKETRVPFPPAAEPTSPAMTPGSSSQNELKSHKRAQCYCSRAYECSPAGEGTPWRERGVLSTEAPTQHSAMRSRMKGSQGSAAAQSCTIRDQGWCLVPAPDLCCYSLSSNCCANCAGQPLLLDIPELHPLKRCATSVGMRIQFLLQTSVVGVWATDPFKPIHAEGSHKPERSPVQYPIGRPSRLAGRHCTAELPSPPECVPHQQL